MGKPWKYAVKEARTLLYDLFVLIDSQFIEKLGLWLTRDDEEFGCTEYLCSDRNMLESACKNLVSFESQWEISLTCRLTSKAIVLIALIDMKRHSLKVDSIIPWFRALDCLRVLDVDEFIPLCSGLWICGDQLIQVSTLTSQLGVLESGILS